MKTVGSYEAKTHLPHLLDEVEAGEEITITRRGRAVARLVPVVHHDRERTLRTIERINELTRGMNISLEEALAWKNEGRKG